VTGKLMAWAVGFRGFAAWRLRFLVSDGVRLNVVGGCFLVVGKVASLVARGGDCG
jgi:hypothetical protein